MDQHHSYATRIRHNVPIRPAPRRQNSPEPQPQYPPFPPPGVELHPEDANSKVFLAVARAFVSVDNRAMTIKDIAERASHFGLVCQNLSAAAQAVTTYLRTHKTRCDQQQDFPLLLSHTLSGTPADDDLVPALYSRSGGDSHPVPNRLTNFRKGTAVWYLSRATGVPCPFSRAGIRLCDYVSQDAQDAERTSKRERRRQEREAVCGQKRKRPLRGCAIRGANDSDVERPPKVKLTLRLKPLLSKQQPTPTSPPAEGSSSTRPIDVSREESDSYDSGDDSMSVDSSDDESQTAQIKKDEEEPWSLPPYPRRSISIPCYTPSVESYCPYYPPSPSKYKDPFRRSPSVPFSVDATPPPDSEDETDDYHVAMTRIQQYHAEEEEEDLGWEADLDSEGDGETMWESPGPRSPSAPLVLPPAEVAVKEEPRDVQGMLDAWEDFDSTIADARVAEVLAKALDASATEQQQVKVEVEATDPWDWDTTHSGHGWASEDGVRVKQEDFGVDSLFPPRPSSPLSAVSSLASQLSAFSPMDTSSSPPRTQHGEDGRSCPTVRPRAKTVPAASSLFQAPTPATTSLPPPIRHSVSGSSAKPNTHETSIHSAALARLLQTMHVGPSSSSSSSPASSSMSSPAPSVLLHSPTPCVSPLQTRCQPSSSGPPVAKVVVHTCQPCHPAVSATQIEEISVYQMMLGPFQLLRRIDSDFVNLSPIVAYSGTAPVMNRDGCSGGDSTSGSATTTSPCASSNSISSSWNPSVIANATVITKGSPEVCGTWVPLAAAQAYVREHLSGEGARALEVFLSDTLVDRFPRALRDLQFQLTHQSAKGLNQFGRHFASTLLAGGLGVETSIKILQHPPHHHQQHGQHTSSAMLPGMNTLVMPTPSFVLGLGRADENEVPLSATEQELFHELCVIPPDWEKESGCVGDDERENDEETKDEEAMDVDVDVQKTATLPPTPTTAVPLSISTAIPASSSGSKFTHSPASSISSMSSLSSSGSESASFTFNMASSSSTPVTSAAGSSASPSMKTDSEPRTTGTDRPLRRSKRVAKTLATAPVLQPSRARSRKSQGGSRNSLS
ncbi:unnamed protein product [Cyclocybe aegerita]|uniref:Uncharacterized protein n=1 Tax=Cyclocybe aegerita TaxID=1973307 RepID=A0A8S0X5F0_CYCAE|nr:unnamed protein product [Cyclocybe aegerita]